MLYDPFQQQAIDHINQGYSVIVSAPTGAGKTAIAEHIINECLQSDKGVIYTAPIKALSNQKFRDFQRQYADKIGILTGDVSINPDALVLIMTTEIFRNKILEEPRSLEDKHWVIFDEIHYIDNYERGTVWEESLMFLPAHMRVLGLSATIPNIEELAGWIGKVHSKPIKTVIETVRPVPLHFSYQCQGQITDNMKDLKRLCRDAPAYAYKGKRYHYAHNLKPNRLKPLIEHIEENNGLPLIYFAFGRQRCEHLAEELYANNFLTAAEQEKITSLFNELALRFGLNHEKSAMLLLPLIKRGIAYHHAGMLPTLKETIERLFFSRLIKVIFTTETFALGINMPAKTVVFDDLRKYYGRFHRELKTRDFYQMAGRAGRRGIDKEGFVYSRVNNYRMKFQEVEKVIFGGYEKVISQFNTSYATLLHLYARYREDIYDIYPLSFHYFQSNAKRRQDNLDLMRSKVELLKRWGYISENQLSDKGIFASQVYGYELTFAELYKAKTLEQLDEFQLGMLAAALVFEPRKQDEPVRLIRRAKIVQDVVSGLSDKIIKEERKCRITPASKRCFFHLAGGLLVWMQGADFNRTLMQTNVDEGEVIRYFRMAVQLLREIYSAPVVSALLKEKARNAINAINRDVVDAEKQLREY